MKKYNLRDVTQADCWKMLEWRNSPCVRRFMFTHHSISREEHKAWFDRMMDDDSARYFIFENNHEPLGVSALTELNLDQGMSFWAAYQSPGALPGTGALMEYFLLDYAFSKLDLRKISGEILESNKDVISLHKSFGFTIEGVFKDHHFDGDKFLDVYRMALFSSQWPDLKSKYSKLLKLPV